ncbi:MAG: LamG-like jellyroll fold domain-containing protein, partial [Candidatus Hadarchaeales archaeon]
MTFKWNVGDVTGDGNADAQLKLYVNGACVASGTCSAGRVSYPGQPMRIGLNSKDTEFDYYGVIDEVRVYRRRLSDAEIAARYNSNLYIADDLIFYYSFDESSGPAKNLARWQKFIVRVPSIPTGRSTIYAYFDNPDATSASTVDTFTRNGILRVIRRNNQWNVGESHPSTPWNMTMRIHYETLTEPGWTYTDNCSVINHDSNPAGQNDYYTSYYETVFYADTAGTWTFYTNSDDASDIIVDGKVVVGWYGEHGAAGDTDHGGTIYLGVGWHELIYRHEEGSGSSLARCLFKKPGWTTAQLFSTDYLPMKCRKFDENVLAYPQSTPAVMDPGARNAPYPYMLLLCAYNLWGKAGTGGTHPSTAGEMFRCVVMDALGKGSYTTKGYTDNLYWSGNPWGNDDDYTSFFWCWFYVPPDKEGVWSFATDSDDASMILVDGQVVVGWYGIHGVANNWDHNGTITLSAGWHEFTYLHEEDGDGQAMRAAFKMPGDAAWRYFDTTQLKLMAPHHVPSYRGKLLPDYIVPELLMKKDEPLTLSSEVTKRMVFNLTPGKYAVAALRPPSGADFDLYAYTDVKCFNLTENSLYPFGTGGPSDMLEAICLDPSQLGSIPIYLATDFWAGTGNYNLEFDYATDATPGESFSGSFSSSEVVDAYQFNLLKGISYTFTVIPESGLDVELRLFRGNGGSKDELVRDNDAGAGGTESFSFAPSVTGSYCLVVLNKGGSGNYTVRVNGPAAASPLSASISPSGWTATNGFSVTWQNPADNYGIACAYCKWDSAPSGPTDGIFLSLGPAASWSFNEGDGTVVVDAIGKGKGVLYNGAAWTQGYSGSGVRFDGNDDYIDFDYDADLQPSTISIEFWIRLDSNPDVDANNNWRWILSPKGWNGPFFLILEENCEINFTVRKGGTDYRTIGGVFSGETLTVGQWTHLVYMYDPATGRGYAYKNGTLSRSGIMISGGGEPDKTQNGWRISWPAGTPTPNGSGCLPATIDEFRIYTRLLTENEILAHAQGKERVTVSAPSEGTRTLYLWLESGGGGINQNNYVTLTAKLDTSPPPVPSLSSPADGSWQNVTNLTLSWSAVTDAYSGTKDYYYEVDDVSDFSTVNYSGWVTGTSVTITNIPEGRWYWRVRSRDYVNNTSNPSPSRWAGVDRTGPPAPNLVSPENNSYLAVVDLTFSWEASIDAGVGTKDYFYEIDNDPDFSSVDYSGWTTSTQVTITSIPEKTWYWRVRARDQLNIEGPRSGIRIVTVDRGSASLVSPGHGRWINQNNITLSFLVGSTTTELLVDDDPNFSSVNFSRTYEVTSLPSPPHTISAVGYGTPALSTSIRFGVIAKFSRITLRSDNVTFENLIFSGCDYVLPRQVYRVENARMVVLGENRRKIKLTLTSTGPSTALVKLNTAARVPAKPENVTENGSLLPEYPSSSALLAAPKGWFLDTDNTLWIKSAANANIEVNWSVYRETVTLPDGIWFWKARWANGTRETPVRWFGVDTKPPSTSGNPVGEWLLNEGSGTTARDSSGNGNNMTISGATWTSGKFGNALNFDGVDDYAITPDLRSLFNDESVTISVWFYPTGAGVVVDELGQPDINTGWHDSQIEILSTGEVKIRVWGLSAL